MINESAECLPLNIVLCLRSRAGVFHISPDVLLYASVSVVDFSTCYSELQAHNKTVYMSMLCTSTMNYTDTSQGDSGGPVACSLGNTTYLAGVVSWSIGCASGFPGANTYVSAFTDTINAAISNGVPPTPVTGPGQFRFWFYFQCACFRYCADLSDERTDHNVTFSTREYFLRRPTLAANPAPPILILQ